MDTSFSTSHVESKETTKSNSLISQLYENAEFNRFGIISAALIIVGCMGGISVGMGAIANPLQLIITVMTTMATLAMILAVAPVKWILNLMWVSLFFDFLFLAINLL